MANHIKFCSCGQCRRGLRTQAGSEMVRLVIRKARRRAKVLARLGRDEEIGPIAVPYTD